MTSTVAMVVNDEAESLVINDVGASTTITSGGLVIVPASQVSLTPIVGLSATQVQAAIAELVVDIAAGVSQAAIIEGAATPAGTSVDQLVYSTIHKCFMRWSSTLGLWQIVSLPPGPYDDFGAAGNPTSFVATAILTGATGQSGTNPYRHPGTVNLRTSATPGTPNTGRSYLDQAGTTHAVGAGTAFRCVFNAPATLDNGNLVRMGFVAGTVNQVAPTSGMYIEINGSVASFKTTAASVTTQTGAAQLVAGAFYTAWIIQLSATSARGILVADAGTILLDVTHTANVPAVGLQAGVIATSTVTTASFGIVGIDSLWTGYIA